MSAAPSEINRGIRVASRIRLRTDVFDTLTGDRGATTDAARARLCGMDRVNLLRIRKGQTPSLELAMHMATRLGVKVEDLFEQDTE
ncbi:hypothetical protein ACIA59_17365 [Micromonospora haikouensis]|uniref:hypothetical protein n=1 Tax=Micromonospora haikouensis TaxID=686309 RepID=UPI0037A577B2